MSELDWELLDRYLAGQATPPERRRLEEWLAGEPDHAALVSAVQGALDRLQEDVTQGELDALWTRIAERTGMARPAPGAQALPRRPARFTGAEPGRTRWRVRATAVGAAILILGVVLAGTELLNHSRQAQVPVPMRVVVAPRGQRAQFQLPDGTGVLLGGGSTLRHPAAFPYDAREVTLEGEAYFTVEHDQRRPFRVRAGDLIATDLGTEFLLQAYPDAGHARVIVRSGTVGLRPVASPRQKVADRVVRPGELGRIDSTGAPVVERADTGAYFAWITGTLVFDATPLREALPQLSRWYDLDFRLADSALGSIPLSGRLGQTLTPARLDLLAGSMGLEQVQRGRTVTFYRKGNARKENAPR